MGHRKLTEVTRFRYLQLLAELDSGALLKRWPEGREPITKADHVESRQVAALGLMAQRHLLRQYERDERWRSLEVWTDGDNTFLKVIRNRR